MILLTNLNKKTILGFPANTLGSEQVGICNIEKILLYIRIGL